ncbi:MAG: DivIVA domain-containing protein [Aquihabitans sp.]
MYANGADRNDLNADDIASRSFTKARKGYESDEVRAYLVGLASVVRDWQRRHEDMERRLVEVERRAADPKDLDEEAVTQLLGEETARVLVDARKAAKDIRTRVEEEVAVTLTEAAEEAAATRAAADEYAAGVRNLADEAEEKVRGDADAYAARVNADADADALTKRTEADEYASRVRDTADREVAELRTKTLSEVDDLRSQAESVLSDRTTEAESSAVEIRSEADAYDARVRQEADAYSELTRTSADAYQSEVQASADTYRQEKITEADVLRTEAAEVAERAALDADALLSTRREEAEAEADRVLADAREQGRTMVQEARDYRERVIADLADRRRAARAQIEQLAATRDSLAVKLTDVRTSIDASHRLLQDAVIDPSSVADLSTDRRFLEASEAPSSSVGVGEINGTVEPPIEAGEAPYDVESEGDIDDDLTDPEEAEQPTWADDVVDGSSDETSDVDAEEADTASGEAEDGVADDSEDGDDKTDPGVAADGSSAEADQSGSADRIEADEEPANLVGDHEAALAEPEEPQVDDLFARIRAEAVAETTPADGEADDVAAEEVPTVVGVTEAAGTAGGAVEESVEPESDTDVESIDAETVDVDPDTDLLDRRDATTNELERQLARKLKRVLSDEQNEVLDLLRRAKGSPHASEVLPSEADHVERYRAAALEDLSGAERAGAGFNGDAPKREADVVDLAGVFAEEMVRQIRGRLELSINGDGDEDEVAERIRALYREWKTQRIAEVARHHVITAFSRGVAEAADDDASFRWLVDHGDAAAPDCEDNALAGPVAKGSPFPTGDLMPPAHPGCRCLLVVVDE